MSKFGYGVEIGNLVCVFFFPLKSSIRANIPIVKGMPVYMSCTCVGMCQEVTLSLRLAGLHLPVMLDISWDEACPIQLSKVTHSGQRAVQ